MLKKRGQTWSFDLVIAVILFIVVVAVFYAFLANRNTNTGAQEQQDYAKAVSTKLVCDAAESSPYCFIEQGNIIEEKLQELPDFSYESIRSDMGIQGDFCVYMVVVDENGVERIVPFDDGTGNQYAGVGSPEFELSENIACNHQFT
ncbi:hypothetical protein JXA48_01820 [Candidatus Woesearchaeota archaeon]|nr:hypothetical protein [Candidatus Woesearchaeota archaeon]